MPYIARHASRFARTESMATTYICGDRNEGGYFWGPFEQVTVRPNAADFTNVSSSAVFVEYEEAKQEHAAAVFLRNILSFLNTSIDDGYMRQAARAAMVEAMRAYSTSPSGDDTPRVQEVLTELKRWTDDPLTNPRSLEAVLHPGTWTKALVTVGEQLNLNAEDTAIDPF